jgi:hypothetical protein
MKRWLVVGAGLLLLGCATGLPGTHRTVNAGFSRGRDRKSTTIAYLRGAPPGLGIPGLGRSFWVRELVLH